MLPALAVKLYPDKEGDTSEPVVGEYVGTDDLRIDTDETCSRLNPGATLCWKAHKKPSLPALFQDRPPRCRVSKKCDKMEVIRRRSCLLARRVELGTIRIP